MADRAHISIAQRAYVEGVSVQDGEATIWFDEDTVPGYGWMFPMSGGKANVGIGILSETCHRQGYSLPKAFAATIDRLKLRHPGCAKIKIISKPIGGVVKMYGGAGPNYFDGGVLIGDAGAFADPMTGEGITQGMESALIASSTLLKALELGRFDAAYLANFEREFRSYFDPSMLFLGFCAGAMRNWHFREFWMRSALRGCERAMEYLRFCPYRRRRFRRLERPSSGNFATDWFKHPALPGRRHNEHPSAPGGRRSAQRTGDVSRSGYLAQRVEAISQCRPGLARGVDIRCLEQGRATRAIIADSRKPEGPRSVDLIVNFSREYAYDLRSISIGKA